MCGPALGLLLYSENDDHLCSVADYLHELAQGLVCVDRMPVHGEKLVGLQEICLHVLHSFCTNKDIQK